MSRNRDTALVLANAGLSIFPCGADRRPLIKWRTASSSDEVAVEEWWARWPDALPAVDCEKAGLVVLDVDCHDEQPDGRPAARKLLRSSPDFDLTSAPMVRTPNVGVHIYFRQNGQALGNARGRLPPGIDVRGCGGYVIAPGTQLPDGRGYEAIASTPSLADAARREIIPELPPAILNLLRAHTPEPPCSAFKTSPGLRQQAWAAAALEGCVAEVSGTRKGARNEALNAAAYRLGRIVARGWLTQSKLKRRCAPPRMKTVLPRTMVRVRSKLLSGAALRRA